MVFHEKAVEPLVTIFIPTKNRVTLLRRAVESVLAQTYANLEIIVIDDASTDDTPRYLHDLVQAGSRVSFARHHSSQGACVARNAALRRANGLFITGLDDDDFFLPDRVESFVRSWRTDPDLVGLYSETILERGGSQSLIRRPAVVRQKDLLRWNAVGNQIFTLTSTLRDGGGYDEKFPAWQDLACWYRLLRRPKAYMARVRNATYVCDVSHAHERISTAGLDRQTEAYGRFVDEFCLSRREAALLQTQLLSYPQSGLSTAEYLRPLLRAPCIHTFKFFAKSLAANALQLRRAGHLD